MFKMFLSTALVFGIVPAMANLPSYGTPEILARANFNDSYNLPPMTFLNSTSPVINNKGEVAFKLMAVNGQDLQGLWMKSASAEAGKIVYIAPENKIITDPMMNDLGQVAFSVYDEASSEGLFIFDAKTGHVANPIKGSDTNLIYFSYNQILNDGHVLFRGTDINNDRSYFDFSSDLKSIATEGVQTFGDKPSYLFRPSVNEKRQWAFKARMGEKNDWGNDRPDQIVLLTPQDEVTGSSFKTQVIAINKNGSATSPYVGFGNAVSLSDNGLLVFVGYLESGAKTLVVYKDSELVTIATEGQNDISEFEQFSPVINSQGIVAFRAKDLEGRRGIYMADPSGVTKIISEGDDIKTDIGRGRIVYKPNFPGFGGDIDLNDKNELTFYVILESANDGKDWGSAVYKLTPRAE